MPASDEGSAADPEALADPLWPLGDEVATALLGLLEVELRGRGLRWRLIARDRLEVGHTDRPWPGTAIDLAPVRERMLENPKADWPELIEQYVSHLRNGADGSEDSNDSNGSSGWGGDRAPGGATGAAAVTDDLLWLRIREPLRARILPADSAGATLDGALHRVVADGLLEAVITEASPGRPGSAQNGDPTGGELVSVGEALGWGVAEQVVFDAARANVRRDIRMEAERFTLDGTELVALFSPSHYAATHVLWLAEYLAGMPGYCEANGVLVVLPHRHLIAVHPIESAAVVAAAGTLLRFAARQFETCPGPISDQLYWWQGGTLSRLPSDSVGETLQLFPSDRFAALLDRLRIGGGYPGDDRLPDAS